MGNPDLVNRVTAERRRLSTLGPSSVRSAGDFERVSISASDGDVLRDLMLAEKPRTVIEVGLAYGTSALAIAEALVSLDDNGARHVIIDAYQDHFDGAGWNALMAAGLSDLCTLLPRRSQIVLPRLVEEGLDAEAAFVDGSHIFHNVFVDLVFLGELVHPGGLVVLDDCNWPSVATAVHYFETNAGWRWEPTKAETRLRAYRLPDSRVGQSFEDFRPFGFTGQC